ncbi:MAG: ABC transporter ATP-binding protein [Devosia nanyangense]|uniref:ABC transporter ATP-binding protein n=1 Tax=Devosia nanyangense TaxID=1228055 RepID=A0A933L734_9HYPH|nr:ABC transporter ATP-binding protein [Devosia nanyangense]
MTEAVPTSKVPPLLDVANLRKEFVTGAGGPFGRRRVLRAVDDISFSIGKGETLGLVGESGCGKTTTGRLVLRLVEPTSGSVRFGEHDVLSLSPQRMRRLRQDMQIIFQDPFGALNPRMTAGELIVEPLVIHRIGDSVSRERRLRQLLGLVGLSAHHAGRFPHEFSGGQRQRLCIARALSLEPAFVVCDEAVSALDVSVQAQILNLMQDLKHQLGLTYLFISHDLGVVRHISDRVAVMYLGQIVETGPRLSIFERPAHPYTQALLGSVPSASKGRGSFFTIKGDVPSAAKPPSGCRFHTRCPIAIPRCSVEQPMPRAISSGHTAACHLAAPSHGATSS